MAKKRSLGRGLESLLSDVSTQKVTGDSTSTKSGTNLSQVNIHSIEPSHYQPRRHFSQENLQELANSIKSQGIIQPIILRSIKSDRYEIVAGERRFRAAQMVGLTKIPAIVRQLPDEAVVAMALIENIQREDLNPLEEARALQRLIEEFGMTHEQTAKAVGKSRTAVSNLLRLLSLTEEVKKWVEEGKLPMGHARALLGLPEGQQVAMANTIISKDLSVRETEDLIRRWQTSLSSSHLANEAQKMEKEDDSTALNGIQKAISSKLEAKVLIKPSTFGKGKIVIHYKSEADLDRLVDMLG